MTPGDDDREAVTNRDLNVNANRQAQSVHNCMIGAQPRP